jgi:hypothetical protein
MLVVVKSSSLGAEDFQGVPRDRKDFCFSIIFQVPTGFYLIDVRFTPSNLQSHPSLSFNLILCSLQFSLLTMDPTSHRNFYSNILIYSLIAERLTELSRTPLVTRRGVDLETRASGGVLEYPVGQKVPGPRSGVTIDWGD